MNSTDKIKALPDDAEVITTDAPIRYTGITGACLKALVVVVEDAVRLGQEQAKEWDRFWDAIGCLSSEITVDDAIAKYQALVSELDRKTRALERIAELGSRDGLSDIAKTALRGDEK